MLQDIMLETDSAWYQIKLMRLQDGYVVEKLSGRKGFLGDRRAWFFWELSDAEQTVEKIIRRKTTPGRKRVYKVVFASRGKEKDGFFFLTSQITLAVA